MRFIIKNHGNAVKSGESVLRAGAEVLGALSVYFGNKFNAHKDYVTLVTPDHKIAHLGRLVDDIHKIALINKNPVIIVPQTAFDLCLPEGYMLITQSNEHVTQTFIGRKDSKLTLMTGVQEDVDEQDRIIHQSRIQIASHKAEFMHEIVGAAKETDIGEIPEDPDALSIPEDEDEDDAEPVVEPKKPTMPEPKPESEDVIPEDEDEEEDDVDELGLNIPKETPKKATSKVGASKKKAKPKSKGRK